MSNLSPDLVIALARSQLYQNIRVYFANHKVSEVEVPLLGRGAPQEPHLQSIEVSTGGAPLYLQTSPEFFMKRLLSQGSGDIFTITKAFRGGEVGERHNPEFAILEWYRLGFSVNELIDDVIALLRFLGVSEQVEQTTYANAFENAVGLNPHSATDAALKVVAEDTGLIGALDRSETLDFLMTELVEPTLGNGLVAISDYPACQSELAQLKSDSNGIEVSDRFEIYLNGKEIANGYNELTDLEEHRARFVKARLLRREMQLPELNIDDQFLAALERGLPSCAGVALGLDRLLMLMNDAPDIADVMHFPWRSL